MRRIISSVLILCLLHTSTYAALAELASLGTSQTHTPPLRESIHTDPQLQPSTAAITPPDSLAVPISEDSEDVVQAPSPTLFQKISNAIPQMKSYIASALNHPVGAIAALVICGYSILKLTAYMCMLLDAYLLGLPYDVEKNFRKHEYGLPAYVPSTQCTDPRLEPTAAYAFSLYDSREDGTLTLPQAVADWLNNAEHLAAEMGDLAMHKRHQEHVHTSEQHELFQKIIEYLHAQGMPLVKQPSISCDIRLGDGALPDTITECQVESGSAHPQETSLVNEPHAKLRLLSLPKQPAHPQRVHKPTTHLTNASVFLIAQPEATDEARRYPAPNFSWDYGNVSTSIVAASRRMLLQSGNTLTLPEAMVDWFNNAMNWQALATETAHLLQTDRCPSANQRNELMQLEQAILLANQAKFTQGTVRCDMDITPNHLSVVSCTPDPAPSHYDHTAGCFKLPVHISRDAAIWIEPDGYFVFAVNSAPNSTPAPTPAPTPVPTPAPTPVPTRTHTETKTLPVVERPVVPANTTTRLYWANWAGTKDAISSIWVAEVNQTSGQLINPRLFTKGDPFDRLSGLHVDEKHGFVYWGKNGGRGIFAARLQTLPPRAYDNVTLLSTTDTDDISSLFLEGNTLYWLRNSQLTWGTVDPTNPTAIANVQKPINNATTLGPNDLCPSASPAGLYVNKDQQQLVMCCQGSSRGPYKYRFDVDNRMITKKQTMSTKIPEPPQSSAVSPELGKIFIRDTTGNMYGTDIDLSIPAAADFEPLVSNTTMVKYFGGMSVVPNSTEWKELKPRKIYWAAGTQDKVWMVEVDEGNWTAKEPQVFIDDPALGKPRGIKVYTDKNIIIWSNVNTNNLYAAYINASSQSIYNKTLLLTEVNPPQGIELDKINDILYWTDAAKTFWGKIRYFPNINLQRIGEIFTYATAPDIAIDFMRNVLFQIEPYQIYAADINVTLDNTNRILQQRIYELGDSNPRELSIAGAKISSPHSTLFYSLYSSRFPFTYEIFAAKINISISNKKVYETGKLVTFVLDPPQLIYGQLSLD